jgi:predicted nucleic acid-binding protein
MEDYLPIYVVDTSLLRDLHVGKIIAKLFELPYRFIAPDVILAELQTIDNKMLIKLGLRESELTGQQVLQVFQLREQYKHPSVNDLFALVTAQSLNATLLTGDRNLRRAAELEEVTIHGTLWVLDEMVRLEIISPAQAIEALILMDEKGSRLPQEECDKRLKQWQDDPY